MQLLFTSPTICNRQGDLSKPWYIQFHCTNPETGEKKRFRIKSGKDFGIHTDGNRIQNKKLRQQFFQILQHTIADKLASGWSPFYKEQTDSLKAVLMQVIENKRLSSTATVRDYQSKVKNLTAWLEKTLPHIDTIGKLTPAIGARYIDETAMRTSNSNANIYTRVLKSIFNELLARKLITVNPFVGIKKKRSKSSIHKIYSKAQMSDILAVAKVNYPDLFLCCLFEYYCFMRATEIRVLRWEDLDLFDKQIRITTNKNLTTPVRKIPIHDDLIRVLCEREDKEGYLFKSNGKLVNADYFKTQYGRLKRRIHIPKGYTLYGFKHTGVCALYRETKYIYLVSKLCGHQSIQTTQIYLRSLGEQTEYLDNSKLPSIF